MEHVCWMKERIFFCFGFCFYLFAFSRAAPVAYGGSQARGQIGAVAAIVYQSHSNMGSEPGLQSSVSLLTVLGEFSCWFNWEWFLSFLILLVIFFFLVDVYSCGQAGFAQALLWCVSQGLVVLASLLFFFSRAFPEGGWG